MRYNSPTYAFLWFTNTLLKYKQQYGITLRFDSEPVESLVPMRAVLDPLFAEEKWQRCGDPHMKYTEWMLNAVFPQRLYDLHGSLANMLHDERLYEAPRYAAKDAWCSFFGRAVRPRKGLDYTFLEFLLREGKRGGGALSHPHFYFDIEPSEWILQPIVNNPKAIRSPRTKVACIMAFNFKWSAQKQQLKVFLLMRSTAWHHSIGEVLGGNALAQALMTELNLPAAEVIIFSPYAAMDKPKQARQFAQRMEPIFYADETEKA